VWVDIRAMEQVLSWVQWGVPITLWSQPPTIGHQQAFSDAQLQWLANKLPCLVHVGLVFDLGNGSTGFSHEISSKFLNFIK
jgi:hypothetical protein